MFVRRSFFSFWLILFRNYCKSCYIYWPVRLPAWVSLGLLDLYFVFLICLLLFSFVLQTTFAFLVRILLTWHKGIFQLTWLHLKKKKKNNKTTKTIAFVLAYQGATILAGAVSVFIFVKLLLFAGWVNFFCYYLRYYLQMKPTNVVKLLIFFFFAF